MWKANSENVEIFSKCKNNICDFVKSGGRVNMSRMTHDSDCQFVVSQTLVILLTTLIFSWLSW